MNEFLGGYTVTFVLGAIIAGIFLLVAAIFAICNAVSRPLESVSNFFDQLLNKIGNGIKKALTPIAKGFWAFIVEGTKLVIAMLPIVLLMACALMVLLFPSLYFVLSQSWPIARVLGTAAAGATVGLVLTPIVMWYFRQDGLRMTLGYAIFTIFGGTVGATYLVLFFMAMASD